MRHAVAVIVLTIIALCHTSAQCNEQNMSMQAGERVEYGAFYNWHFIWLKAGYVTFAVDAARDNNGDDVYRLSAVGGTYPSYDFFYKVRDTFLSVVDTLALDPKYFRQVNYEGHNLTVNEYYFNGVDSLITGTSFQTESKDTLIDKQLNMHWPAGSADLLTMVYKARNIDFARYAEGDKIPISMLVNDQVYNLYIRYLGRETVTTRDKRTFRCLKFTPLLVAGTIFTGGEDMTVWITDDDNRLPILVEAKVLIGSVKAIFIDAAGLRHPIDAEVK